MKRFEALKRGKNRSINGGILHGGFDGNLEVLL